MAANRFLDAVPGINRNHDGTDASEANRADPRSLMWGQLQAHMALGPNKSPCRDALQLAAQETNRGVLHRLFPLSHPKERVDQLADGQLDCQMERRRG